MGSFKLKLVMWFALLALLPLAVAFYGYDSLTSRSETGRTDAALQAGLRGVVAGYSARLADATPRRADSQPIRPCSVRLRRHDERALAKFAAAHPTAVFGFGAGGPGARLRRRPRAGVRLACRCACRSTRNSCGRSPPGSHRRTARRRSARTDRRRRRQRERARAPAGPPVSRPARRHRVPRPADGAARTSRRARLRGGRAAARDRRRRALVRGTALHRSARVAVDLRNRHVPARTIDRRHAPPACRCCECDRRRAPQRARGGARTRRVRRARHGVQPDGRASSSSGSRSCRPSASVCATRRPASARR